MNCGALKSFQERISGIGLSRFQGCVYRSAVSVCEKRMTTKYNQKKTGHGFLDALQERWTMEQM